MLSLSLNYPKKSHRKIINIPQESTDLAELMGIILGDGGIGNKWQIVISLNSISDIQYSRYIFKLINHLFSLNPAIRKRPNQNTLVIVSSSSNMVDFIVNKGMVRGNKILQNIDMPDWIRNNSEDQKRFIRGLVDTDGCLYIHKHTLKGRLYRNIGFCFASHSRNLIISVSKTLLQFGIKPHITKDGFQIYLYSEHAVLEYLSIFGSSNDRITQKYEEWRGRIVA